MNLTLIATLHFYFSVQVVISTWFEYQYKPMACGGLLVYFNRGMYLPDTVLHNLSQLNVIGDIRLIGNRIMELVEISFVCKVAFLIIRIVVFDTTGIDRCRGKLMFDSLIALPIVLSVAISYLFHMNLAYAAVTSTATLVFSWIVFRMVAIGHAF